MPKVWKIAPGGHAGAWPECHESGCIVMGWRKLGTYAGLSEAAIRKKLKQVYKPGEVSRGPRAARSIWRFANAVQPEHVVVANNGRGNAVGIGVVKSDYLAPNAPGNPRHSEWYPSARLVDWRIAEPVDLPNKFFFVQDTVWPLDPTQCDQIRRAYLKENPKLRKVLDELFENVEPHVDLGEPGTERDFAGESDIEGLRSEYRATRAKRSRRLRNKAFRQAKGVCAVCQRDYSALLGGRGQRVLQVHHLEQLAARDSPAVTKLTDLAVVCANCHLLLHLDTRRAMKVGQLRNLLKDAGYLAG
jgi:hypothetical protein